jgi:hypothetical protein
MTDSPREAFASALRLTMGTRSVKRRGQSTAEAISMATARSVETEPETIIGAQPHQSASPVSAETRPQRERAPLPTPPPTFRWT